MPFGTVVWFDDISGAGRIRVDGGGALINVSHKSLAGEGYKVLDEGQRVKFEVTRRKSGFEARCVEELT